MVSDGSSNVGSSPGIVAASAGLSQLQGEADSLAATPGGGFGVDSATPARAAQVCRDYAQMVQDIARGGSVFQQQHFGACQIGHSLSWKFHYKASDTITGEPGVPIPVHIRTGEVDQNPNTLSGLLAGVVDLLGKMENFFDEAGQRYTQTEQDSAAQISSAHSGQLGT